MSILIVSHNIYLTREERYSLVSKIPIEVVGVSIPVWAKEGVTTEPAKEVFCKYEISDNGSKKLVSFSNNKYQIVLPSSNGHIVSRPTNEEWRQISKENQELWYEHHQPIPTSKNLLDMKDGGAAYLKFRYRTIIVKEEQKTPVFHFVEIKPIEILLESLT
jgi:hypothetical protein